MKTEKTAFLKLAVLGMGIVVFMLSIFWLPKAAGNILGSNSENANLKYPALMGIYFTVIPFYIVLYQALKLLKNIELKNTFSKPAAKSLNLIKCCACAIAFVYAAGAALLGMKTVLNASIAAVPITFMFAALTIALFAAVLEELLMTAIEIKSENDLTI
ncbi:Protein of unknown function [Peptoclostridium litorale DSM 5388]|uniref:DUF2975 domain-containing protein n=1 Tax=Peptoclostridium litorale DSM 5388 TaxID=1121324 RepID=A0A069RID9_PEPLI|nr:DUF2975 domain-containing protein [Peptoclostridium litorale]KDR96553.1 hypothetical protein CLIT_2c01590 [Peptoclostridium litorale DSM 5388]SIN69216.1 Protein of unknown function [Peptoclostridium litorale DSM 5388]